MLCEASHQRLPQGGHQLVVLLADGLAQVVRLGGAEPAEAAGDGHVLLLVDGHAVGRLQDGAQGFVVVDDRARVLLVARVRRDVLHRPRPVEGDDGDEVLELRGADIVQRLLHAGALELEHPGGVAPREHPVGLLVVERQPVDLDADAARALDDAERGLDHVEVAQAEEVHLEQAELGDVVHVELRDEFGLALLLQRQVLGEGLVADHHRGRVDGVVTDETLEAHGEVDDLLDLLVGVVGLPELAARLHRILEARRRRLFGDHLGDPVAGGVGLADHAGGVAHGRPRRHGAEGDDLGDAIAAVLVGHVVDDLLAAGHAEVHVDVGHALAPGIEETLEEQVVLERVDVGDAERVADDGPGGGPTAGSHGDAVVLGELHVVPDDEEVGVESHLADDSELELEALDDLLPGLGAVPAHDALLAQVAQVAVLGEAVRHRIRGQLVVAEVQADVAALGDLHRAGGRAGVVPEALLHLLRRLEVELVAAVLHALLVGEAALGLDTQERVVRVGVLVPQVVHVVGGDRLEAGLLGELRELRQQLALLGQAGVLQFDVDVLRAEKLGKAPDLGESGRVVAVAEQHRRLAAHAAGERDEALVILAEKLPVGARLVVVALEIGRRRELDEVPVAGLVAGEQREVGVLLLDAGAAAPVGGHVELEADDGLDTRFLRGAVELDGAAERAVVGESHGRHAQLLRPLDELLHAAGAVEQRILAVHVEMDEVGGHRWPDSSTRGITTPAWSRRPASSLPGICSTRERPWSSYPMGYILAAARSPRSSAAARDA